MMDDKIIRIGKHKVRVKTDRLLVTLLIFSVGLNLGLLGFDFSMTGRYTRLYSGSINTNRDYAMSDYTFNKIIKGAEQALPNETAYCLYGEISEGRIIITKAVRAPMIQGSPTEAEFMECVGIKYLGTIHSHPTLNCRISQTDIYQYSKSKGFLTGIICANSWVSKEYDSIVLYVSDDGKHCCEKLLRTEKEVI